MANDPLYDLRVERLREEFEIKAEEARQETEIIRNLQEDRRAALARGDRESAKLFDKDLCEAEQRYLRLAAELQQQPQGLSAEKQDFVSKYSPEQLVGRPHWFGKSKYGDSPISGLDALAHAHEVAKALNIPDDSKEYFDLMQHAAPQTENAAIRTGDEALNLARQSKYGKDLKASEYNRQVRKLAAAKQAV